VLEIRLLANPVPPPSTPHAVKSDIEAKEVTLWEWICQVPTLMPKKLISGNGHGCGTDKCNLNGKKEINERDVGE
jgi:hypothetical protein